jgi:predicted Ser/Thr protein kinase
MTPMDPDEHWRGGNDSAVDRREQLLAEAVSVYGDILAREEELDVADFCARYPDIQNELKALLETMVILQDILGDTVMSDSAPMDTNLPDHLSDCRILGVIGSGGMGQVLLAHDDGLGRKVAIKILSPKFRDSAAVRTRFMQEARALARLSHPNIVRIYSLGQPDEIPHFVMEYITGAALDEACRALTLDQKVDLLHKIVLAVDFLHQNRILHRDLKPGNILVGPDLEPKLLDFGLAREVDAERMRITHPGEVIGTPAYFSPEQARGDELLDERSDIFSLGTIFYELLTGVVPFRAESQQDLVKSICMQDPELPRRLNPSIPGALQSICLQCLEKNASDRFRSARELADDLARYLAGESVLANPASYARMMAGRIEQHVQDLCRWEQDRILSAYEVDSFRKLYDRLCEREDAWILEVRRLSLSQVTLYLGAWILVVAAALVLLFHYRLLSGTPAVLIIAAAAAPTAWLGIRCWKQNLKRIAIAFLLAFCLLLPTVLLVAMKEWKLLSHFTQGKSNLEFFVRFDFMNSKEAAPFRGPTNAQLWWGLALSLPAFLWLRRFTRATVFSLVFSAAGAMLCVVTLLRMGMLDWFETDPGRVYFRLLPFAVLFFVLAAWIERKNLSGDSRYFYPVAVLFTFIALSGLAGFHEPYARWLKSFVPRTRGQIEYLFIVNAGIYLLIQSLSERFGTAQMRSVAKVFRFVIPGHVLTSILLLGIVATSRWNENLSDASLRAEARFFEILLPLVACLFVFGSVPKQMKNFFVSGILFLAVGIVRLQQDLFKDRASWPLVLLATGLFMMLIAANYTHIKLAIARLWRMRRTPQA